jgi:hypothetical protein
MRPRVLREKSFLLCWLARMKEEQRKHDDFLHEVRGKQRDFAAGFSLGN